MIFYQPINQIFRDLPEPLENRVIRVNKVFQELKVSLGQKEIRETQGHKVLVVQKVIEEKWVCRDFLVSMVFRDYLDLQVQKVLLV